jgi:two-component system secretion system response regulator SalR
VKILLFDDHRLFGESLKKLLIESQFVSLCYYVERENDFFRTFREKEFDIILLDINLKNSSEKNGFEILADILSDIEVLTEREIEILRAICKGDIKKKIAKNLFISERTLYNHIQNIYDKLEVSNTVEAYNKAIKLGYIEPLM